MKKQVKGMAVLVMASGLAAPLFANWDRSGGGDFIYEDPKLWTDGIPNATFNWGKSIQGDQNVTLTNDERHSSFTYKSWAYGETDTMTFRGHSMTINGTSIFNLGNIAIENAMYWCGETDVGYGGSSYKAKMTVRNGGHLYTTGPLKLGLYANSNPTVGFLYVENGGRVTVSGANPTYVGQTKSGLLWIDDGGEFVLTNKTGAFYTSYRADGYMRMAGGRFLVYPGDTSSRMYFNFANDNGSSYPNQVHISGGEIVQNSTSWNSNPIWLGYAFNPRAEFYMDGGFADFTRNMVRVGQFAGTGNSTTMTLDGDARFRCYILGVGYNEGVGTGNVATFNLNGNAFLEYTRAIEKGSGSGVTRRININGGTLSPYLAGSGYTPGWDETVDTVVYPKGGALHSHTHDVSPTATFRRARGYGLASIVCVAGGSNYVSPPIVTITGGSGSNATAIAVLKKDRTVERFVVTCPGEGYAENDILTVTLTHGENGSGCTAGAVTLAENTVPTFRKTGASSWVQACASSWDGKLSVEQGALRLANGGSFPKVEELTATSGGRIYIERSGASGVTSSSSVANLMAKGGVLSVATTGSEGDAKLTIGSLALGQGGVFLQPSASGLSVVVEDTDLDDANGNLNGYVYTRTSEGLSYPESSVMARASDGTLTPVVYDTSTAPAVGANWEVPTRLGEGAVVPAKLASIKLNVSLPNDLVLNSAENVELTSGMILQTRPQGHQSHCAITGGGAFTTAAAGGLFLYGPTYQHQGRSYSQYNPEGLPVGQCRWWLDHDGAVRNFYVGPFADPDASTHMAVNICNSIEDRPDMGFVAFLAEDVPSTFSGGLNLINGGVIVKADSNLGSSGSPVRAYGNSSFGALAGSTLCVSASRAFELSGDAKLMLMPASKGGLEIAGPIKGSGELLTADYGWSGMNGYPTTLSGSQSDFTGTYWIHGITRIAEPSGLAAIRLADATNGVGTLELSGSFTRAPGNGIGQVCWQRNPLMQQGGVRGGFGAFGGDLTVNLGGDSRTIVAGSDYLPEGAVISLNSECSTGVLKFENRIDLNGKVQNVAAGSGGTVVLSGGVIDSIGGGMLEIDGDVTFDNFVWTIDPSRYVEKDLPVTVGHVRGRAQGTIVLSPEVPGWTARVVGSRIKIGPRLGMGIVVR